MSKVIVIGAGPAGMMAAGTAAEQGKDVILIEKNNKVGCKLAITGKGRCNITNDCDVKDIMEFIPRNGKFLYSAIRRFTPQDVMNFFEKLGVPVKVERGNRVFPVSDKASDVVDALRRFLIDNDVRIVNDKVEEILTHDGHVDAVRTQKRGKILADKVILCTGGKSYPKTGSAGDGYVLAEKLGHTNIHVRPSLVPLVVEQKFCRELQGLSLKNVFLRLIDKKQNKVQYEDFGEMLFTHFGVSGPMVLSASAHMDDECIDRYAIEIDMKPALDFDQLDKRVLRDFSKYLHKNLSNALNELLPKRMISIVIRLAGLSGQEKCDNITKQMRYSLVQTIKCVHMDIVKLASIDEAIVTRGGVNVKEINPSTMQSKLVEGLYFAGEIIDVDAYTGGFNLQIAFSTGRLAGASV